MKTPNGGDCYQANGNEFISTDNSNTILVHGIVINQIDNLPMGHCWLEETIIRNKGTNKEFEYTICKDFSNGRNIELLKELYYLFGNIDSKKQIKYNKEEYLHKIFDTKNWGPWDLKCDR
jgi:hypothetical protein